MRAPRLLLMQAFVAPLLAGCGGGVFLSYQFGDDDEFGPSVSLTSSVQSAPGGAGVRLAAAASDADGIDNVALLREDQGEWVLLARDLGAPFAFDAVLPNDGRALVRYFARATDNHGDRGDSNIVTIDILR